MTSNTFRDEALILTAEKTARNQVSNKYEPSRAGKIHRRDGHGGWTSAGYNIGAWFQATPVYFDNLRGFFDILKHAGSHIRDFLVGDVIRVGVNPTRLRRAKNDAPWGPGGLSPHPRGHYWICWEVDGVKDLPHWFDPTSNDRSNDADFVRWWIDRNLPPSFRGCSAILQWSSSALFRGKVAMHIWMWMDRPVSRPCLHHYFQNIKHTLNNTIDITIWDDARVHYIADPRFEHVDGSTIADPLDGWRWQWVEGERGDVAEALPEWVDQPTWDAHVAALAAAREKQLASRKAHKAALVSACLVSAAMVERRATKAKTTASKGKSSKPGPALDPIACADQAAARAALAACVEQIEDINAGEGAHQALLRITLRAARSCLGLLDEHEIRDALEEPAVAVLMDHPDRPRPKPVAKIEADGLITGAFNRAKAEGLNASGATLPAFAAIGVAECLIPPTPADASPPSPLPHNSDVEGLDTPDADEDARNDAEDPDAEDPSPIALDAPEAALDDITCDTQIDTAEEAALFQMRFIEARAELAHIIAGAVACGGRHAVKAPAGLGKSHAICETLIAHRRRNRLGHNSPVHIAAPDLSLARELREDLRKRGANAVLAVTRTVRNCEKFTEVLAASRLAPNGGQRWCEACQWHPKNAGSTEACRFWRAYTAQESADFICESHALEALKTNIFSTPEDSDAPLPVHIDWASFNELEPGDSATPCVRRTDAGLSISAKISYRLGEGSQAPIPRYEDTPRWTSASKASLIDFLASAYGCAPNRASVAEAATRGATVNAFIDWTSIGKLSQSTALYRPAAYYENKGFLCGWHIGVERADAANGGKPLPDIEFTGTFPVTRESKAEIRAWVRAAWGVDSDLAMDDYAREHIDEWPVDAQVIDESILHALKYGGTLTRGQITDLQLAGELAGEGVNALLALMWKSEENKNNRKKYRSTDYFNSDVLAEQVHGLTVISKHESGSARLDAARRFDDDTQRLEHLRAGWSWEAVEALRHTTAHAWQGAYIAGGMLHVQAPRKLNTAHARTTVLLDATMTEPQSRAALGSGAVFHNIRVGQNPFLEVIHVPANLGPHADAWGDATGPKTKRNAAAFLAAAARWGGPDTVLFTHKRVTDPERCWMADHLEQFGDVTYHGAPQSRGSNKWRDKTNIIMTGHYVPVAAKRQQAELLALACGEVYAPTKPAEEADTANTKKPTDWDAEAAWLLEGGAVVQELARIRPLDATADKPKRLIILDSTSPEAFGIQTTERISQDRLAWEELGFLPPLGEDAATDADVMGVVVREVIDLAGGALPTGGEGKIWPIPHPKRQVYNSQDMKALLEPLHDKKEGTAPVTLSCRINSWCRKRFRSWRHFAAACGVEATQIHLHGRPPLTVLHHPAALPLPCLEAHLAHLDQNLYRLSTSAPWTALGGMFDEEDKVLQALWPVEREGIEHQTLTHIYKTLAITADVTTRTVYNWIQARRLEGEDNSACLVRLWAIVRLWRQEQQREEAERMVMESYGTTEVEAAEIVTKVFHMQGCAPWGIGELAVTITVEGEVEQGVCGS